MRKTATFITHLLRSALYAPMLLAICAIPFALAQQDSKRPVDNHAASGNMPVVQSADRVVRGTQAVSPALTAPEGACSNYNTTTGTGTITPGTTDTGSHCDDCATPVTFPFPVSVYGQTFTSANLSSDGSLDLIGSQAPFTHGCQVLPNTLWTMAILPYQDDLRTDNLSFTGCNAFPGATCGIFTSVTGTAPNRHFNIEWRAVHFADTTTSANFEVVFSENSQTHFDVIYGATSDNGLDETSGVQASSTGSATTFSCGTATLTNGLKVTYGLCETVPTDFNHDGFPDFVLFNGAALRTAIWFLNNNSFIGSAFGPTLPNGWSVIDSADFDGDGNVDYALFHAATQRTAIWYLNGTAFMSTVFGPMLPPGWTLVATGDFNGDDHPDFVLYNATTRRTAIWFLNNSVFVSSSFGPILPPNWAVVGVADFNRDGRPDYALFNATTRQTAIWYLMGTTFMSSAFGPTPPPGWELIGVADFNVNAAPDYLLFNASLRRTAIWYLNNNIFTGSAFGPTTPPGWSIVAP